MYCCCSVTGPIYSWACCRASNQTHTDTDAAAVDESETEKCPENLLHGNDLTLMIE